MNNAEFTLMARSRILNRTIPCLPSDIAVFLLPFSLPVYRWSPGQLLFVSHCSDSPKSLNTYSRYVLPKKKRIPPKCSEGKKILFLKAVNKPLTKRKREGEREKDREREKNRDIVSRDSSYTLKSTKERKRDELTNHNNKTKTKVVFCFVLFLYILFLSSRD